MMHKHTIPAVKVVPNGQIYRQLFDAQLQLNQSLSRYDSESRIQRFQSWKHTHSENLPLIRLNEEETQHGILTTRQKTWVGGFPNDPYTENPVQYKHYNEYLNQKFRDTKVSQAGWEVKGLADFIISAKQGSDIVERVEESRKERHASALEDMHQALALISMEMEPKIEELTAALLNKLAVSDEEIANILASFQKDEDLMVYQLPDLFALWEKIQAHSPQRQNWISEMDLLFKKLETDRMNKIYEVFRTYGNKFQKISHLMFPDLQRFMDKESQMINQTVLSNHRSYADLYVRLISTDVQRERTQYITFLRRIEDWKLLNTKIQIENFKDFMKAEIVVRSPGATTIKQNLLSDQKMLNTQRLKIIQTLCDMKPPDSTKLAVNKWREDLKKLSEELGIVMQMHMSKLHEHYEQVCQQCLEKVDSIKLAMIETGVCSSHKANQLVDEFMLPLVGKQQKIFEQNLETVQNVIERHSTKMQEEITMLFTFAEGAAHVWDMHEIGLAKQENGLQECLEKFRQQHDQNIQEKEANLDIIMDRMRQDADEIALKDSLVKALNVLDKIRDSYEEFHVLQTQAVQTYPSMVKEELDSYEQAICHFFSVSRTVYDDTPLQHQETDDFGDGDDEIVHNNESEKTQIIMSSTEVNDDQSHTHVHNTLSLMKESIRTSKGTTFYILQADTERRSVKEDLGVEDNIEQSFLTEMKDQEFGDYDKPDFIQNIDIPNVLLSKVRKVICLNFLEHLEDWCEQALIRADSVVVAKKQKQIAAVCNCNL